VRRTSLKRIYLATLAVVFLAALALFVSFDYMSQQEQTEEALLEEARMFTREMDAVWQFMDNQQKVINTSFDGDYDFKGLHCSIVGKSVGAIFSYDNELSFMSYLYGNVAKALHEGRETDAAEWSGRIVRFWDEHASKWLPAFMEKTIEEAPKHSFGAECAVLAEAGAVILEIIGKNVGFDRV